MQYFFRYITSLALHLLLFNVEGPLQLYLLLFRWGTHLCMSFFLSVCPSIHPSIHPSVAYHISGTVHHLIIIFGTHVNWCYLQEFFSFSFWFFGLFCKKQKISPKWKIKITSVTCYISGTVYHMIMIFGTLV